eukprot:m.114924 g.114924  ORF g.114924 m.114924 type:complete len:365 (+) comp12833_c2_seq8:754-1848(+)
MLSVVIVAFAAVLVLASLSSLSASAQHLDQITDYSEDALRILTESYLWQSFNASWSSDLVFVDVYLGTEQSRDSSSECQPMQVTFDITNGAVSSKNDIVANSLANVVMRFECDESAPQKTCIRKKGYPHEYQCAGWLRIPLSTPIPLMKNIMYSFSLNVRVDNFEFAPVAGVAPKSENHGGPSSLITGVHESFYTQYAFRTYMSSAEPRVTIAPHSTKGDGSSTSTTVDPALLQQDNGKKVGAAGIVIPVVVGLVLILLVVFVVVQRRRWSKEKILDSSRLYSIRPNEMEDDEDDADFNPMHHKQVPQASTRHPIYVRSRRNDEDEEEENGQSRWAQDVAYSSYGQGNTSTKRQLPNAPTNSEV